ncbi:MAG: rhamnan synthesis F family protein [Hyphomicrobium sp.]
MGSGRARFFRIFGRLGANAKLQEEKKLVEKEFDAAFYLSRYPDIVQASVDPLHHFMLEGWRESRDPAPWFSTAAYLELNSDVRTAAVNPFLHYIRYGRSEGRQTKPAAEGSSIPVANSALIERVLAEHFDADYYSNRYKDIKRNNLDPLKHYIRFGWKEGRDPAPWFSTTSYLERYEDVRTLEINPFFHYIKYGRKERRTAISAAHAGIRNQSRAAIERAPPTKSTNSSRGFSVAPISDVCRVLNFYRWLQSNIESPSKLQRFDPVAYLMLNPDIAKGEFRSNPAKHFDAHGVKEKRVFRPADVVELCIGAPDRSALDLRKFMSAFRAQWIKNKQANAFECALRAMSALGTERQTREQKHELVKLRRTFGRDFSDSHRDMLTNVVVVCHLYYVSELEWIKSVCARLKEFDSLKFRFVFSISESMATSSVVSSLKEEFGPSIEVYLTENRGHDLGALLSILRCEKFSGSEWLVTLHGKKSSQNDRTLVAQWKEAMADSIVAGLSEINRHCKEGDETHLKGVGGYFSQRWQRANMGANLIKVSALRQHYMSVPMQNSSVEYLSGSMMVTRLSVWREITELTRDCIFSDTGALQGEKRTDGLLEHAVERIVQEVATHRGLHCVWN